MSILSNNILKFLKTGLMILFTVSCLTACHTSGKKDAELMELEGEESLLDQEQRSCWQGDLLAMFYDVMADSSLKAYPKVTGSAMPFMMVAFALWLSIRILKHVSSVVEESPAGVWTEVGRMAFMCLVCGILASSTPFLLFVLNKIIFPIYYALLEYAGLVLNAMTDSSTNIKGIVLGDPQSGVCLPFEHPSMVCKIDPNTNFVGFPTGPSEMMQCLTCALSDRLQIGFALAKNLLGGKDSTLTSMFIGIVIFAIFTIVKIGFVFYMVDAIFRMSIMVILLPCFILAYPFRSTRKWTKEGFITILNSAALLACLAILLGVALAAMQWVLIDNAEFLGDRDIYREFGPVPLSLLLISFLILKSTGVAASMANALVGGGGKADFQKKAAKAAAMIAKAAILLLTSGTGKFLMKNEKFRAMKEKADEARKNFNKALGRHDENDN